MSSENEELTDPPYEALSDDAPPVDGTGNGQAPADIHQNIAEWHGKDLIDSVGEKIGKLEEVYVDVETDEPMFATVKEGFIGRHLTFVPLTGANVTPDNLQV